MPGKRKRTSLPRPPEKPLGQPTKPLRADPKDVFGALADWHTLPQPEQIGMIILIDFEAVLHVPAPNPQLYSSARLLEAGLGELNWHLNQQMMECAIDAQYWNEPLVKLLELASKSDSTLVVVHTTRNQDQNAVIDKALRKLGVSPDMLAYRDPLQPTRVRKNQLVQRLWGYFSKASLNFYQGPHSRKETRDMRLLLQSMASYERPLPQLFKIVHPAKYFEPQKEREIVELLVQQAKQQLDISLACHITSPKWVWCIDNYREVLDAVAALGDLIKIPEDITSYSGRWIDYSGASTPQPEDRGKTNNLTARSVIASGTKVSLSFGEFAVVVATINKRVGNHIKEIEPFEVRTTLDMQRLLSIKEK